MWGFEPQQYRLKGGCSTFELHTPHLYKDTGKGEIFIPAHQNRMTPIVIRAAYLYQVVTILQVSS